MPKFFLDRRAPLCYDEYTKAKKENGYRSRRSERGAFAASVLRRNDAYTGSRAARDTKRDGSLPLQRTRATVLLSCAVSRVEPWDFITVSPLSNPQG